MFVTLKRKNILIGIIIVALVISLYLNFHAENKKDIITASVDVTSEGDEPKSGEAILVSGEKGNIVDARNNREIVRSKALELLTKTLKDNDVSSDARKNAENALAAMAEDMENENECETLLESKGFGKCVVFISENSVNVIVSKKEITDIDTAKINDIVFSVTNIKNIKIINV